MKTITKILGTALCLTFALAASAQNGWNWGEQVDVAKEKNVIYTDAFKAKNYEAAVEPLEWLLENTPDLNPSIYQRGVKIYQELAKKETDAAKKEEYIQRGLELHDIRIKYFSEKKDNVLERKGIYAYGFYKKDKDQYENVYNYLKESFEANGSKSLRGSLVAYMDMVYKNYLYKRLTDEQVIDTYSEISDALNAKMEKTSSDSEKEKLKKSLDTVDRLLAATKIVISCDMVESRFGPKLDEGNDVNMAKRIFDLMIKGECIERPLALKAAGVIQNDQPTYGVAKFLGTKYAKEENYEEAIKFYKEAASLTDDNSQKAEMYVSVARIQRRQGQKSTARSTARRALSFDPNYKDAYELIGDLYFGSYGTKGPCYQEKSQVEDRAVFIAAYDQYRRAGASAKMKAAKAQFPSIQDIFNSEYEEGQSITIGCWINTTVALERRPETN